MLLEETDLLLDISKLMSIFILDGIWAIELVDRTLENNVFANSFIGATIQDGSKRERSDVTLFLAKYK